MTHQRDGWNNLIQQLSLKPEQVEIGIHDTTFTSTEHQIQAFGVEILVTVKLENRGKRIMAALASLMNG